MGDGVPARGRLMREKEEEEEEDAGRRVVHAYYALEGLYAVAMGCTLSVDDLFLLHAGLSLWGVFLAGASFTAAIVLFELPTGVIADTVGRRGSVLASLAVRTAGTLAYVLAGWAAPLLGLGPVLMTAIFCGLKMVMGMGFTFYSGAIDAWLVDALREAHYRDRTLDQIFARGAAISRLLGLLAALVGAVMAQSSMLLPFVVRTVLLGCTFVLAARLMTEAGIAPVPLTLELYRTKLVEISRSSARCGWENRAVRMIMFASATQAMLTTWGFYAWHSYILNVFGDMNAVWLIGVISALISCARSLGNLFLDSLIASGLVERRTTIMLCAMPVLSLAAVALGGASTFLPTVAWLLLLLGMMGVIDPVRQACLHREIPSGQRATVVSFQQIFVGAGSVIGQLVLGYIAQTASIPTAYALGGSLSLLSLPSILALRWLRRKSDLLSVRSGD